MIHHSGIMLASNGLGTPSLTLGVLAGVVILGLSVLAFTSYRYVIGYFLVGMVYWLLVEGLHWAVVSLTALTATHAYIAAIALSFLPLWALLSYKPRPKSKPIIPDTAMRLRAGQRPFVLEKDTHFYQHCIRHTPVIESDN